MIAANMGPGMDEDQRLSIGDLVRETGLSRRTIHYYLHEGLLPSPEGTGRRAYYLEDHLLRLHLISLLREAGLKLDSIGTCLAGLGLDEMRRLVERADEISLEDPRQLAGWLYRGCAPQTDPFLVATHPSDGDSASGTGTPTAAPEVELAATDGDDRTWRRREIRRGVELHFRSDVGEELRGEIGRLIRIAEALLGEPD